MIDKLVDSISKIRELIWPLLEPLENREIRKIDPNEYTINDKDDIEYLISIAEKHYQSEEKRRNDVESKSIIFIGSFGVAVTVLINLTKDLVINTVGNQSVFMLIQIALMTLSVVYLCRAIWFSIKALKRANYRVIGFPKSFLTDQKDMRKRMLFSLINTTELNYDVINEKVDFMTMAQEYFLRALVVVAVFAVIIMLKYFYQYKEISDFFSKIFSSYNFVNASTFLLVLTIIFTFQMKNIYKNYKA